MDGHALGKIILVGEHSVVYGHPAIAIPFSALRSEVVLTPSDVFRFDTKYFEGDMMDAPYELRGMKELVVKLVSRYKEITPVTIAIRSNLPEKSGLGSSASVAKAIIDAFNNNFGLGLTKDGYANLLKISENIYHEKASGIDAATIVYETPIIYQAPEQKPIRFNIDGALVVFYSNGASSTKEAVIHVRSHPQRDIHISGLGQLTANAKYAIEHNDLHLLASMFNAAHHHLRELGISTPELETLRGLIVANGGLGVKITGGGMGGCLIALFPDEESALKARKALKAYPSWQINLRNI